MATPSHVSTLLTLGPVEHHLKRLFAPMVIGVFAMISVNLIDTYFISLLGTTELAAMSFTFPVVGLIINLCFGLSIGVTATLSRTIGAGHEEEANLLAGHAIIFAGILSVSLSIFTLLAQVWIFKAMGAGEELIKHLHDYMFWWALGLPFLVFLIINNSILRSRGDSKTPMRLMLAVAFINAILDPIFIFGLGPLPAMYLEGAAIATMITRCLVFLVSLRYVMQHGVVFQHLNLARLRQSLKPISSVGIPAAMTNALTPFSAALITALIALHGKQTVAGYGMAIRLEGMFLLVPMVMGGALSPFVGQNWGAHLNHRVIEGLSFARKISIYWGIGIWILVEIFASNLGQLFSQDPAVQQSFALYLRIISISYVFQGLVYAANATFNAIDRPLKATLVSVLNSLLLAVPLGYLGHVWFGFKGIVIGLVIARIVSGLLANRWVWALFDQQDVVTAFSSHEVKELIYEFEASHPDLALKMEEVVEHIGHLHDVHLAESKHAKIGFYIRDIEMGHIHMEGHFDLRLPPQLRNVVIKEKWASHHRTHYDGGWVTHDLKSNQDFNEIENLLKLVHIYYEKLQDNALDETMISDLKSWPTTI